MSDDRERMADLWIRAARLVGVVSIPALVGLVVVAPEFVQVVLGSRWSEATPVIQILAVVGIIQSLQTLNGEVLLALNRSGTLLRFTIFWFVCSVGAFAVGVQWGILACRDLLRRGHDRRRTTSHVHHDACARDLVLEIRPCVLRCRSGDGGDGRGAVRGTCCPGHGRAAGGSTALPSRRAGRVRLRCLLPVARPGGHARDQRRCSPPTARTAASRQCARASPARALMDAELPSSRSARSLGVERWPIGHSHPNPSYLR